jgi:hypothetical protein
LNFVDFENNATREIFSSQLEKQWTKTEEFMSSYILELKYNKILYSVVKDCKNETKTDMVNSCYSLYVAYQVK